MTISFGPFQLEPDRRELLREGETVSITAKVFDTLVVLVESRDRVVEKSELLSRVWAGVFVQEATLVQTISMLRKALGCGRPGGQRYIVTIPGKGYQFVADVTLRESVHEAFQEKGQAATEFTGRGLQNVVDEPRTLHDSSAEHARPAARSVKKRGVPRWSVTLLVLAGAALVGWSYWPTPESESSAPQLPKPLTSYPGREIFPTFAPDGDRVAFAWEGENRDNWDIYVKMVGQEGEARLTEDPAQDWSPAWSPDGTQIAFLRRDYKGRTTETIVMPSIGGANRTILQSQRINGSGIWNGLSRLVAWHPDSEHLIVSHAEEAGQPFFLYMVSTKTRQVRKLTHSDRPIDGDVDPAVSPDGRRLAFRRMVSSWTYGVYVVDLTDDLRTVGEPRKVGDGMFAPMWTRDGSELVMVESEERPRLWRMAVGRGRPRRIREPAEAAFPALSPAGDRAAFSLIEVNFNVWQARTKGEPGPTPLIASTYIDGLAEISPHGEKIAFTSSRSGDREIWVCDRDGSNRLQLTDHGVRDADCPAWSPDGSKIAYHASADNYRDVFVIGATGGTPLRLTHLKGSDVGPSWSRDGEWVYFTSDHPGERSVWKIPSRGGDAILVTTGSHAKESVDGQTLFVEDKGDLWAMPAEGGPRSRLLAKTWLNANFEVREDGIYLLRGRALEFYDFETKVVSEVFATPGRTSYGLSIAPDGETVLFTQSVPEEANIMIVDGFR